ncbi:MAG: AAA family ATPase [Candidatus Kryptoniota bacterium]
MEKKFSGYFRQAFGMDLIVHRNAGNSVPLYIGERPTPKQGEDRVSEGYLLELEKLDLLDQQGDGMRAFVGVLLNAFISTYSILFIDEPEAFLHPPQAKLLGKMLANDMPSERQLFLATHSEDFLKGLLDANISNLKIIRLQREGMVNRVSVLNSNDINAI